MKSRAKKDTKKKIEPPKLSLLPYRPGPRQFELLARRAYDAGRKWSIQRIMDAGLFQRDWELELEERREKHRKLGLKDTQFYQSSELRKMGIKPHIGRPFRRPHKMKKAK